MPKLSTSDSGANIAIIGGGVAGMSCALWLKQFGFTPIIIEKNSQLGGQLLDLDRVNRWVLGAIEKTSVELALAYTTHIEKESVTTFTVTRLLAITPEEKGFNLELQSTAQTFSISVRACVIATGVRALDAIAFKDLKGFQSLYSEGLISFNPLAHLNFLPFINNKVVAVIGGGDNAHFTAKDLALAGAKVLLLIRTKPKAAKLIRQEIESLIKKGQVLEYIGVTLLSVQLNQASVEITCQDDQQINKKLIVDRLFARLGFAANTEFLDDFAVFSGLAKSSGYLIVNSAKQTSVPWVYAIGDVANTKYQSVVNAIADGASAAKSISEQIEQ